MHINLLRLKPVIRELRGIRDELARLADCWEAELSNAGFNVRLPKVDSSGPEPTIAYVDEEADWVRESIDRFKREDEETKNEDGQ